MPNLPALNILIEFDEECHQWTAHCLEMDMVEEGDSALNAAKNLMRVIPLQVEECVKAGIHFITPAPLEYYQRMESATQMTFEELSETSLTYIPSNAVYWDVSRHVS